LKQFIFGEVFLSKQENNNLNQYFENNEDAKQSPIKEDKLNL
jgi:hypothetical protein